MKRIRIGQKAEISLTDGGETSKNLVCAVVERLSDRLILDATCLDEFREVLREGDELRVNVYTHAGILVFDSILMDMSGDSSRLMISLGDEIECIQRRMFVRAGYEAMVCLKDSEGEYIGTTKDIGGGGIRFYSNEIIENGKKVWFQINLAHNEPSICGEGRIMKSEFLQEDEYVIIFEEINEYSRSKLIKKCYEQEAGQYLGL